MANFCSQASYAIFLWILFLPLPPPSSATVMELSSDPGVRYPSSVGGRRRTSGDIGAPSFTSTACNARFRCSGDRFNNICNTSSCPGLKDITSRLCRSAVVRNKVVWGFAVNERNSAHWSQLSALSLKISALSITLSVTPGVKIALNQAGGTQMKHTFVIFVFLVNVVAVVAVVVHFANWFFSCDVWMLATLRVIWYWVCSVIGRNNRNRATVKPHQSTLWVSRTDFVAGVKLLEWHRRESEPRQAVPAGLLSDWYSWK